MKSSTVFKFQNSDTNVCLNFRHDAEEEFDAYGEAFRRAGRRLFLEHFVPETRHDLDALPIGFLYRQAIELSLKAIIRMGNRLLKLRREPVVTARKTHSLVMLLEDCKPAVDLMKWKWNAGCDGFHTFDEFRTVMIDLEKDDELGIDDRQADMWRYPVKNDGSNALPEHFHFDVAEFVTKLDVLIDVLQGLASCLEDLYDGACEAMAEAQYD